MSEHSLSAAAHAKFNPASETLPFMPAKGPQFNMRDWVARRAAAGKPVTTVALHAPRGKQKSVVYK